MNTTALIVAWWFLALGPNGAKVENCTINNNYVNYSGSGQGTGISVSAGGGSIPASLGPYPTEAMCRAAEHLAEPSNRAVWTASEIAMWRPYDNARTAYDARMLQLAKENPRPGFYKLWDGTKFHVYSGVDISVTKDNKPYAVIYGNDKVGKSIPIVPSAPEKLAEDTYKIQQPCVPVKGWYTERGNK